MGRRLADWLELIRKYMANHIAMTDVITCFLIKRLKSLNTKTPVMDNSGCGTVGVWFESITGIRCNDAYFVKRNRTMEWN